MKKLLSILAACVAVTSAQAFTVIDSWNDVKGATNAISLAQLNSTGIGGVGFSSLYEQTGSAVAVLKTNDVTVALANYVSGQTANTQHWAVAATPLSSGSPPARRTQSRATPGITVYGASGAIWFSFTASLLTTNGDVALILLPAGNSFASSGQLAANTPGLRIGLGSVGNKNFRGALGVGPAGSSTVSGAEVTNIVNGVNGTNTGPWFVPTNGTGCLILGRIDTDTANNYYPRVSIWYNPDVPDAASLPAPTLSFTDAVGTIVPTTLARIGYQNVRSTTLGVQNEMLDNVKISDELNAFDIVYKNAPLPIPVVNITATVPQGNEQGPTNIVFQFTTDKPVTADLAIPYTLAGVATNGYIPFSFPAAYANADFVDTNFNPDFQSSSVVIKAGQSSATVVLQVIDDTLPEGIEFITNTITAQPDLYILGSSFAVASIADNNDANVLVQYMFTRTLVPQVWDTNVTALPAINALGAGYSGVYNVSPDAAFSAGGDRTAGDPVAALANNSYVGFTLAPAPGYALTLTNLDFQALYGNYLLQVPAATGAVVFVRSSLDGFAADLTNFVYLPDNIAGPYWTDSALPLDSRFANLVGSVEFRLYVYDDSPHNQVGVRIDNLYFGGSASVVSGVQQVVISGTATNAAEPATPGQFTVTRYGDATSPLTVNYTVSGTAGNGVDYTLLPGSVTIPAGQTNATITVSPIDDSIPESTETVILTLAADPAYGVLPPVSATVYLADNGDIGGLVTWLFNENNNSAGSLAAVAAPTPAPFDPILALNAAAGTGLNPFGANSGGANVGHGYGTGAPHAGPSSLFARGDHLGTNATDALADSDYVSFSVAATPGKALTLTNFSAWVAFSPGTNQTAWAFLRSSIDGFASDLGTVTLVGYPGTSVTAYTNFVVPLAIASAPGTVEFRLYFYCTRSLSADIIRVDDVLLQGSMGDLPAGAQVVTVVASAPNAAEPSTPGAFTLTRYGDASAALTVNYSISGTAANGVDYALLSGTTNFAAGATTVVVPVTVIDDIRPEPTETVNLTLTPSASYYLSLASSATVSIADNADLTPLFTFAASDTNAYERVASLLGAFTLTRTAGDANATVTINFTLSGSAVLGVDYLSTATNSITFGPGVITQSINIYPIDNSLVDGNRTVTLTVQTDPSFILDPPASGTVTIVDDEAPAATVLWSDNFDAGTSAANYNVVAASDSGFPDYAADFAFDYSTIGLASAPHSTGNTTLGLKLDANLTGYPAGVNLFPVGQHFTNNFALRFDLYLSENATAGAENEVVIFGINQSGTAMNWFRAAGGVFTNNGEGILASIATRDVAPSIFNLYAATNTGAPPTLVGRANEQNAIFNTPPFAQTGRPNNASDSTNKTWVEVELSQVDGLINLKVNNNLLAQYANLTPFTNGNIFIGYGDPWATVGSTDCFALVDNLRVVAIASAPVTHPIIKTISVVGSTVTITFTAGTTDALSAIHLSSSATVNGTYVNDDSAVITGSNGNFQATTSVNGGARFYRVYVQHN